MAYNPYIHRTGARAGSAMKMRNEYQIQFGIQYYLIVEGESDEHFFENILDCSKCKVMNLEGKAEVKKFIEDQNSANKKGYLGIVDADFEHIDGYEEQVKNVIITDVHDIEMLMFSSNPNMRRIYSELTENMIINNFEEKHQKSFLDSIIKVAYDIGLLKMVMKRPKYYVNMKDIFYSDIINKEFELDIDTLIERVKKKHHTLYEIKKEMENLREKNFDEFQVCCGHDVTNILAIRFTSEQNDGLGYGKRRYVDGKEIERLLRAVYDFEHFLCTKLYSAIIEWENSNNIYILDRKILKVA